MAGKLSHIRRICSMAGQVKARRAKILSYVASATILDFNSKGT